MRSWSSKSARFTRRAVAYTVSRGSRRSLLRRGLGVDASVSHASCDAQVCRVVIGGVRSTPRSEICRPIPLLIWNSEYFRANAPNQLWIADITYVPTRWEGFLYLAVILDAFSRRVVGWSMTDHLRAELVVDALEMAVWNRRPGDGVIHHSDHGCQYTSLLFTERRRVAGIRCSMGSVGDCYDNAMAESFFATVECELLAHTTFSTHLEARSALFEYIEVFYNRQRRHSALDYLTPDAFERRWIPQTLVVA